jgi:hypothetical protein
MRTVERLEQAVKEAEKRGFAVRFEPLQGAAGGLCEVGQRKYIFVDLTATLAEQLAQMIAALKTATPSANHATIEAA